jgi:hypothetical protein
MNPGQYSCGPEEVHVWLAIFRYIAWGTRNLSSEALGKEWTAFMFYFRGALPPESLNAFEAALLIVGLCPYRGIKFEPGEVPDDLRK